MRAALGFLTVVGGATPRDDRAPAWFGVVGALVGLAVGGAWWVAGELWPALLAAVIAVAVDAALTGFLHLDGLADSADGLLPPVDRAIRTAAPSRRPGRRLRPATPTRHRTTTLMRSASTTRPIKRSRPTT